MSLCAFPTPGYIVTGNAAFALRCLLNYELEFTSREVVTEAFNALDAHAQETLTQVFELQIAAALVDFSESNMARNKAVQDRMPLVLLEEGKVLSSLLKLEDLLWNSEYAKFYTAINVNWPA
jgi:hypothetical protein